MAITSNPAIINGTAIVGSGTKSNLHITAATVVKSVQGRIAKVNVTITSTDTGAVYDCATTGAVDSTNRVALIPAVIGSYSIDFPCRVGIVVVPGSGQTVSVSFA